MLPDRHLLESTLGAGALSERPHLFSESVVELPDSELGVLANFVKAVTTLIALPGFQKAIAERQGGNLSQQTPGVCLGFDFHRTAEGPKLIEINTNAGGSLLVTLLNQAWGFNQTADQAEQALVGMFINEWQAWGAERPLQTIAIVDESPEQQYLHPEFVRWQKLFEGQGIQTIICGPEALVCNSAGQLSHQGVAVDLLYNRMTDFSLDTAASGALSQCWQAQASGVKTGTLITPHPVAHALWADKRNLDWLSDPDYLASLGLNPEAVTQIVHCVPRTVPVLPTQGEYFWGARKTLFFKPQAGFGSRATYRGDKLTKRVFEEILQGGYVAQAFVPPPELMLPNTGEGELTSLKYDLRVYAYNGEIQLLAARLYQGQTTNFRTPGGGFAPVRVITD
jgi:hypothetical protein